MARYNESLQAQLDAAQEMLNANLLEDAWIVLNRLDAAYPDSPEVVATMGDAALKVGDFEFAYEMFDRVIDLEPVWSEAWSARARCRLEMCEFEAARSDLEHAVALDPANPEAHFCLAILAEFDNDEVKSRHEYMQAAMVDGDHFIIPLRLASDAEFQAMVDQVIGELRQESEQELGFRMPAVTFGVRDLPDVDFCAETGLSPLITCWSPENPDPGSPTHFVFFRRNIERTARTREDILAEIEAALAGELVTYDPQPDPGSEDLH